MPYKRIALFATLLSFVVYAVYSIVSDSGIAANTAKMKRSMVLTTNYYNPIGGLELTLLR